MSKPFLEEDKVRDEMTLRRLGLKLWPYIWARRGHVIAVLCMVVLYTALGRALPFLFGYAVDEGIKKSDMNVVYWIAGAYLVFEVLRVLLGFAQSYLMEKIGNRVLFELREKLIRHVQKLPTQFFDKNPSGRIVTRVTNDVLSLGDLFNQGFTALFVNGLELFAIAAAMLLLSPRLTFLTLLVTPLAVYLCLEISRKCRFYFGETKKKMAQMNAFTAESLNGMKVLQLFHQTSRRRERFSVLSNEYRSLQMKTVTQFALLWPVLGFFNVATVASALFFAALFRAELNLTIGQVSAFVLLVQSFYAPIRTMLERYNQFQNSLAGADRIFTLLSETLENDDGQRVASLKGEIEIKNLTFRYGEHNPWALKNVDLHIRAGESVALVGRTGSGKSTLAALLQRFYDYEFGSIKIDGVELRDMARPELRRRIAVVQQDPFIFKGTLYSNIALHNADISPQQAETALRRASGERLLEREGGLYAPIEERGGNLSVGEKQIVAFARALAFDPDILILDEATANIDSENEALIQKATREAIRSRTSIIIAHRLSTIVDCDKIVVLDAGHVAEIGNHRQLLEKEGLYSRYYYSSRRLYLV